MADICLTENIGGQGGIAGGGGNEGQSSIVSNGIGANSYGYPVLETVTGVTHTFTIQLTKDYTGAIPLDMTGITKVMFEARPTMNSSARKIQKECTFDADGKVTLELGPDEVNHNNGVWYGEFKLYDANDVLRHDHRAYLCIRKGMDGSNDSDPNTITAMDVRLAIMDVSPEANVLLDDLEFSDIQIYAAVQRCIDEWEEKPPTLQTHFNSKNFPFREHLIKGVVGYLMQQIAYKYTRNRMQYNAAGLTLDTSDKGPQYIALAQAARGEWIHFVNEKKAELNMSECYGWIDIPQFGGLTGWW